MRIEMGTKSFCPDASKSPEIGVFGRMSVKLIVFHCVTRNVIHIEARLFCLTFHPLFTFFLCPKISVTLTKLCCYLF